MKLTTFLTLLLSLLAIDEAVGQNTRFLEKLFKENSTIAEIVAHPDNYQVQIMYSQINRDSKNKTSFKDYAYNLDKTSYFYPGNALNLPAAVLVLEKINNLNDPQVDRNRYVKFDTAFATQTPVNNDPLAEDGLASFANFIRRMFLLNDNDAYNRCYEFLGQKLINERFHQLGYNNTWFLHRLGDIDNNVSARHTNPISFYRNDVVAYYKDIIYLKSWPTVIPYTAVYKQVAGYNELDYYRGRKVTLKEQKGVQSENVQSVNNIDFSSKSAYPLEEMHDFIKQIFFPNEKKEKLNLSQGDYEFLYKSMGTRPNEMTKKFNLVSKSTNSTTNLLYKEKIFKNKLNNVRIFSNSGKGFGYLVENAYVVDFASKVEFVLSIVIHCKAKNDSQLDESSYQYNEIGVPFIEEVARIIYQQELTRSKKILPDLKKFELVFQ